MHMETREHQIIKVERYEGDRDGFCGECGRNIYNGRHLSTKKALVAKRLAAKDQ